MGITLCIMPKRRRRLSKETCCARRHSPGSPPPKGGALKITTKGSTHNPRAARVVGRGHIKLNYRAPASPGHAWVPRTLSLAWGHRKSCRIWESRRRAGAPFGDFGAKNSNFSFMFSSHPFLHILTFRLHQFPSKNSNACLLYTSPSPRDS